MTDRNLPTPHDSDDADDGQQPEVRLELTRAGVQEVLSLYSRDQRNEPDEPAFSLSLKDVEAAIRERRQLLAQGLLLGIGLALVVWLFSTPLYPVTAQVVVERQDSARAEASNAVSGGSAFVATQAEVMQSDSVLAEAVAAIPRADHLDEDDDPLIDAAASVVASPVSGTQVIALGYLGPDAYYGVALLESIVDAYRTVLRRNEADVQREKLRAKQAEITVLDQEAIDLEAKLVGIRIENGTFGSAEGTAEAQTALLRDIARQLTEARNQRIALESRLENGSNASRILDPATSSLQEQLWAAEAELARVRLTLTDRHPAVEAANREVTVLRRQIQANSQLTPESLEREIAATRGLEEQLDQVYEEERRRMATIEQDRREEVQVLAALERVRELSDTRRAELLDQRLVTRLAETGDVGISARLIEPPALPNGASWPKPKLLLLIGAAAGLAGGLVAAIISLQRQREVEREQAEAASWVPPTRSPTTTGVGLQ